jgi:hypothetical protein
MKKQLPKRPRIAPLQRLKVRPIEDPAEQAALDELLRNSELLLPDRSLPEKRRGKARGNGRQEKRANND